MTDEKVEKRRWWHTLPGAFTAIAGVITAITGLIVAVNQTGLWSHGDAASRGRTAESNTLDSTAPSSRTSGTTDSVMHGGPLAFRVSFPQGTDATLGDAAYKILGTHVGPRNPDELALRLRVRMTNNGPYPANFWSATFRLLVNGVARAPIDELNELVDGNSAGTGVVTFAVPESVRRLALLLLFSDQKVRLPMKLSG